MNPAPAVTFWCWCVPTVVRHVFVGDLEAIPVIDPARCGYAEASLWRRAQSATIMFPAARGLSPLTVDFSTASLPNAAPAPAPVVAEQAQGQEPG